jgi:hypothetical protein
MPGPRDWPDHVDSGHDDDSNPPPHVDSGHDDDGDQPPHVDSSHDDAGDTPFERLEEIVDEILRQQERLVPAVRAQLGRMARELTRAVSAMQRRLSGLERRVGGGGGGAGAARRRRLERKLRALAARRPKLIAAVRGQFGAMSREAARVFRGLDERLDALERSVARLEGKKR